MSARPGKRVIVSLRIIVAGLLLAASGANATGDHGGFYEAMDVAMERMMAAMHVPTTRDVDGDFAAMMIPHHQGAIDMAIAELRYGTDPQLRRIAQEIVIDQQQEITAMQLAIGDKLGRAEQHGPGDHGNHPDL
jgi:uncharacterized protein (DUF305 family)